MSLSGAFPFAVVRPSVRQRLLAECATRDDDSIGDSSDESDDSSYHQSSSTDASVTLPVDVVVDARRSLREHFGNRTYEEHRRGNREERTKGVGHMDPYSATNDKTHIQRMQQDGVLIPYTSIAARLGIRRGEYVELEVLEVAERGQYQKLMPMCDADSASDQCASSWCTRTDGTKIFSSRSGESAIVRVDGYIDEQQLCYDGDKERGIAIDVRLNCH